jgi:hypothetical protein
MLEVCAIGLWLKRKIKDSDDSLVDVMKESAYIAYAGEQKL